LSKVARVRVKDVLVEVAELFHRVTTSTGPDHWSRTGEVPRARAPDVHGGGGPSGMTSSVADCPRPPSPFLQPGAHCSGWLAGGKAMRPPMD